jgi:hypothetical protein
MHVPAKLHNRNIKNEYGSMLLLSKIRVPAQDHDNSSGRERKNMISAGSIASRPPKSKTFKTK